MVQGLKYGACNEIEVPSLTFSHELNSFHHYFNLEQTREIVTKFYIVIQTSHHTYKDIVNVDGIN